MINKHWSQLSPKVKRIVIIVGIIAALALLMKLFSSDKDTSNRKNKREDVVRHVLTDRDTRVVSLEGLSADLRLLRNENENHKRTVEKLTRELESIKSGGDVTPKIEGQLTELEAQIKRLQNEQDELSSRTLPTSDTSPLDKTDADEDEESSFDTSSLDAGSEGFDTPTSLEIDPTNPNAVFDRRSWPTTTLSATTPRSADNNKSPSTSGFQIKTHQQVIEEAEEEDVKDEESIFLPAGSILTGVFLNGLDAPTGQGARRDPFPATLRIQKEAILPNRFRADVRECFLIVAGYGDLSSERAYLRGETISCVREDGGVIESNLDSYAVGEDGKAGVRGRLVSKQGQIIAKSLMAGFMSGVSKAFDVNPIPIIDTSGGSQQYQRNSMNADWVQSAAVNGASSALDRVADFYMDMADGMFPVIEVDAGRQIDIIMSRGTSLQLKTKR